MTNKLIFGAVLILASFSCAIFGASVRNPSLFLGGYVDIDGQQYYVNASKYFTKDEARADCQSRNMELISFEEKTKYDAINLWAQQNQNELDYHWFWMGAERVNTTDWRWEVSGKRIKDFYWADAEPNLAADDNDTICLSFVSYSFASGWCDDICDTTQNALICQ
ncbi:E-selectin-like [Neocloeon triangulifer]|uniref:E-selectin-like n=1 Tax=Neocloeon triangulifer TaxID=2078957 RepID=UPI00286F2D57|nr:E-selectin-like [Neocloeon triangulifer]